MVVVTEEIFSISNLENLTEKNFKTRLNLKETVLASFHGWIADAMGMSGGENGKVSGLAAYGGNK